MENDNFAYGFLVTHQKNFPSELQHEILFKLRKLAPEDHHKVQLANYHKSGTVLTLSILLGLLGIDRFYIGDRLLGLIKLVVFLFLMASIVSMLMDEAELLRQGLIAEEDYLDGILGGFLFLFLLWFIYALFDGISCNRRAKYLNYVKLTHLLNSSAESEF